MTRPAPMCLPVLIAFTNESSDHSPMPVVSSGVRFAAYDTPHAPLHAVRSSVVCVEYGLPFASTNFATGPTFSGWPESDRSRSASGPFGPIFLGVWQSWQPPPITSILPRSTGDTAGAAGAAAGAGGEAGWLQPASATATGTNIDSRVARRVKKPMGFTS